MAKALAISIGLTETHKSGFVVGRIRNSSPVVGSLSRLAQQYQEAPAGANKGMIVVVRPGFVLPDGRARTLRSTEPSTPLPTLRCLAAVHYEVGEPPQERTHRGVTMKMPNADEDCEVEDVPVSPRLCKERRNRYGSVPGLDDEELASPEELERQVFMEEWWPVLRLPVRHRKSPIRPTIDEDGLSGPAGEYQHEVVARLLPGNSAPATSSRESPASRWPWSPPGRPRRTRSGTR